MFKFNHDFSYKGMSFHVKANPGVYTFGNESGIGKTYVYNAFLFESSGNKQSKIFAYTFSDYQRSLLLTAESLEDYNIILLDRFDLYCDAYRDLILELCKDKTILLDFKNIPDGYFHQRIGKAIVLQMQDEVRVAA